MSHEFAIFSGTADPPSNAAVAAELGVPLVGCEVDRFPDGGIALREHLPKDAVVVSPDIGRVRVAGLFARCLDSRMVVVRKPRESAATTVVAEVIGMVAGRACLIVDDMTATGGTIASSIIALPSAEARSETFLAATRGLLLSGAREKLTRPTLRKVFVTDTVRVPDVTGWPQLCVISIAPLMGDAIKHLLENDSIGDLYHVPAPGVRQPRG